MMFQTKNTTEKLMMLERMFIKLRSLAFKRNRVEAMAKTKKMSKAFIKLLMRINNI